jgi:hypothetical protein
MHLRILSITPGQINQKKKDKNSGKNPMTGGNILHD